MFEFHQPRRSYTNGIKHWNVIWNKCVFDIKMNQVYGYSNYAFARKKKLRKKLKYITVVKMKSLQMSGQDANMADCRQSKTRTQWCHFSTLTESISQTAVEGEGWLKQFKGRQLITSPSLMSLAPHTLHEGLHNFVILLRLSYRLCSFFSLPAELFIFYFR